ncbi:uncharacterized protein THITE_2110936 [Thermothielavioides terrestris NRRL 8126]|uniref:Uncharacterized protein n=2 Tax=Thermothielavioides terrestris TaxID=2587410 RepID=G2QVG3_THETT|nr:uncharacterized protein THITE_2110936 [Thermothielavioides terrestris NRRL 8126]AEO64653.1 hypothetical protein THITE_2110936 [Thermothielavioides terrestris NRRL 8126]
MMEINIPIIVACMPVLKPLVDNFWPRLLLAPPPDSEVLDSDDRLHPPAISSPARLRGCTEMGHL